VSILLVGTSYRESSLQELEVLEKKLVEIRRAISSDEGSNQGIEGSVIVSTCNRFEVYVETETPEVTSKYILDRIRFVTGIDNPAIKVSLGSKAITHLFRVSAGLDSMIVGEVEISGQVKRALTESRQLSQTSRITESLFQRASEVSKRVASETGLGTAGRSLITSGLNILRERGFDLRNRKVLVIGTGAYARVVISALAREGVGEIFTYSHSGRAEIFSQSHGTTPVKQGSIDAALENCEMIISCSGVQGAILRADQIQNLSHQILPIIDLSLARDVENSVKSLFNVIVIDLEEIHRNAPIEHLETINSAEELVSSAASQFSQYLLARRGDPLIRLLREHIETIVLEEVDRVRRKSGEELALQVNRSLRSVTKTIFHKPTIAARDSALNDESDEYQRAIQVLFGLSSDSADE